MVTQEFKIIVKEDIEKCKSILQEKNMNLAKKHENIIINKYDKIIPGLIDHLDMYGISFGGRSVDYLGDIKLLKAKLELFYANNCNVYSDKSEKGISVQVNNNNSNDISIEINIDFSTVRKEVEEIETLPEDEIAEIISKINEIEAVYNGKEKANKKWTKLKNTLNWLSTKGVDIAIKIIPLILKTISENQSNIA